MAEGRGCLAALFGQSGSTQDEAPDDRSDFRLRADFLSAAELSFFHVVKAAVRDEFVVFPKVNLGDLFFSPTRDLGDWNRISRKHIDFVLCDPATLTPRLGIELDDSTHDGERAHYGDAVKEEAFESAGLPLLRMRVRRTYLPAAVKEAIYASLDEDTSRAREPAASEHGSTPLCPSCEVPMVLRPGVAGRYASFYGCTNYPRCRERRPTSTN